MYMHIHRRQSITARLVYSYQLTLKLGKHCTAHSRQDWVNQQLQRSTNLWQTIWKPLECKPQVNTSRHSRTESTLTQTNYRATINGLQTGWQFEQECTPKTTDVGAKEEGERGKQVTSQTTFLGPEVTMSSPVAITIHLCSVIQTMGIVVTHFVSTQESQWSSDWTTALSTQQAWS